MEKKEFTRNVSKNRSKGSNCPKIRKGRDTFSGPKRKEEGVMVSETNDARWYSRNENLLRDVASISFGTIAGHNINVGNQEFSNPGASTYAPLVAPGIMILDYVGGPGYTSSDHDAVNIAARDLFSRVRKMNSGYSNYDPNDMMMYVLALNEVYSLHSALSRIYAVANLYNVASNYAPRKIMEALGYDFDDIIQHLPQLRALIDTIAVRANIFAVPNELAYLERTYWMTSGLYTDGETLKSQMYGFRPLGYRTYNVTPEGNSELVFHYYPYVKGQLMKYADAFNIASDMLDIITGTEDFAIISGDIRKAYEGNLWTIGPIAPDIVLTPAYDKVVLSQIENTTLMGMPYTADSSDDGAAQFKIYTTNELGHSLVNYGPGFALAYETVRNNKLDPRSANKVLNAHIKDVDPVAVMEMTRNTVIGHASQGQFRPTVSGTELVMCAHIYYGDKQCHVGWKHSQDQVLALSFPYITIDANTPDANMYAAFEILRTWTNFDWSPSLFVVNTTTNYLSANPVMDLDNYTVIKADTLDNIHYCALLSMFNVVNS